MSIKPGHSHCHDVNVAKALGVNAAIVFSHVLYWLRINAAKGHNIRDGKVWMYETQKDIANFLDYLTLDEVKKAVIKLLDSGLLVKDNFNKNRFDQTSWYTVSEQDIIGIEKQNTKVPNGTMGGANGHDEECDSARCIIQEEHQEEHQEEQQQSPKKVAAAFSSAIPKKEKSKDGSIYSCLLDLTLTKEEMIQITRSNTEERIDEAVRLVKSKKKPPRNLGAFIVWAATDEIKAPLSVEDNFKQNREFAKGVKKNIVCPKGIEFEVLSKHSEIVFTSCAKQPICLYYSESGFKDELQRELKTNKFRMRNDSNM